MIKMILLIAAVAVPVFAGGSSVGNLKNKKAESDYSAMASGYWDTRNDTIADDTTVIKTKFPGLMCISVKNETADDMTIIYTTETQPTIKKTIVLTSYMHSYLMPSIHTIYGTDDGATAGLITLYFWNLTN
jgi:hypothetical protein